ncbi:MBOAT family O-acyltransferase [Leptospira andrefontaineae]|nr:MBOAT family O-acyltransferase [Leptospira andrefontaineae]
MYRKVWLISASIFFYGFWSIGFLFHFLGILAFNYLFYYFAHGSYTKIKVSFLVFVNLLNLAIFKYLIFFETILTDLGFSVQVAYPLKEFVLPLAISFYTFQIIAFHIDCYRGELKEKVSLEDFFFFILFFPQLIAGPIIRWAELKRQIDRNKLPHADLIRTGSVLIFLGLLKKVVIGDQLGTLIDPVFQSPEKYNQAAIVLSAYGFAVQIYSDFSGYSDIARGLAILLGFNIPRNFDTPYFATTLQEFWQRWHITLSRWLRDYLYIPLGGNKSGKINTYINLLLTMLLGGLWHGANYNFLIWGGMHGLFLAIERPFIGTFQKYSESWQLGIRSLIVFHFVCITWIFFRSSNIGDAIVFFEGFSRNVGSNLTNNSLAGWLIFAAIILHAIERNYRKLDLLTKKFWLLPAFGVAIFAFFPSTVTNVMTFIYFQF